ncbi:MAG: hypothetical protein P0119_06970 [Nitrospira sp.]|nr:hypothetical protein [Nitrospira sp.]
MTLELTTKLKLFIQRMKEGEEQAQWGYELLLKRSDFDEFFDHLKNAGLFGAEHNRGPLPADQPGYVHIPYWHGLDYLEAVAKRAGETNNFQLAEKVMGVVRAVSQAREPDGMIPDNYHTYRKFAEILGLVPTAAVVLADLDLIPGWIQGKFNRGGVCHALDKGAMRRLLASESLDDWDKAISILRHCTAIIWVEEQSLGESRRKPVTIVEDHWLAKLIKNHAPGLGKRAGQKAAEVLVVRLRETYDRARRDLPSWLHRPAIEDHAQNHEWLGPENRFVEGLRDVLVSWVDHNRATAKPFVETLIGDDAEILRRIGIHVLDRRWEKLKEVFSSIIGLRLLDDESLHEVYGLLQHHFETFDDAEKAALVEAIRQLGEPSDDEEEKRRLQRKQRKWLSTIAGKGYAPADTWFNSLDADQLLGDLSDHPDFHSYMESWSGHGPAAYQPQEIIVFAETGSLIQRLNDFQEQDSWRGPTTRALVDSLEAAVALAPTTFLGLLQDFINAKRPFQYGVISGFEQVWSKPPQDGQELDWGKAWPQLVLFLERLIGPIEFWTEQTLQDQNHTPNRDWIPPIIAQLFRSGTQDDEKAYSPDLLPRTWRLLVILLKNLDWRDEPPKSDSMTQAINSSRGKAIEAIFSHALRACRLADRERQQHADVWASMKGVFEDELAKCQNGNFDFSTLAGAYITQLDYIDRDWLKTKIGEIFPNDFQANFNCALGGLAYANITREVYGLLVENGIIDRAFRLQMNDLMVIQRLVEHVSLAYLWNDETLDSSRFAYIFESGQIEAIDDAVGWFWSIRKEQLSTEQVERIIKFWERCILWSRTLAETPAKLLSSLSRLACYIRSISDRELDLLLAVAPHVHVAHHDDFFYEELDRLADTNAEAVAVILKASLDTHVPSIDFEDRLESILGKLAASGKRDEALVLADRLKQIPGMAQIFRDLQGRHDHA